MTSLVPVAPFSAAFAWADAVAVGVCAAAGSVAALSAGVAASPASSGGGGLQRFLPSCADRDIDAFARQRACDRLADAFAASGDDRLLSRHRQIHGGVSSFTSFVHAGSRILRHHSV